MKNYPEIEKLFGTPLSQFSKPKTKLEIKPIHILMGGLLFLVTYHTVDQFSKMIKNKLKKK